MTKSVEVLLEMEAILDQLLIIAERLSHDSSTAIMKDDIEALQIQQESLFKKLYETDRSYATLAKGEVSEKESIEIQRVRSKLEKFQEFNADFIDHLSQSHGLIQFGKKDSTE
jgi:hypothetical protein